MADAHVVGPVGVDRDVGGQRNALLVDGGPQVEVFDEGSDVDADLAELGAERWRRVGHLELNDD